MRSLLAQRPAVRVNQLGYLPMGPKHAVWVTDAREPDRILRPRQRRRRVCGGRTRPWPVRPEPTSGLGVHVLDFSALRTEGEGFAIEAGGVSSRVFACA